MAFLKDNKENNDNYFSNGYSDSWFSAKDGNNADEWYELSPEALENIAGGVGGYDEYDTHRFWRDQNGVLREIR